MNFALKNFTDGKDTMRITELSNDIMKDINNGTLISESQYKTGRYNDGRVYNVQYKEAHNLIMIERVN